MKRLLTLLFIFVIGLFVVLSVAGSPLLHYFTESQRNKVLTLADTIGMRDVEFSWEAAAFSHVHSAVWTDINVRFLYPQGNHLIPVSTFIEELVVSVSNVSPFEVTSTFKNVRAYGKVTTEEGNADFSLGAERIQIAVEGSPLNISQMIHKKIGVIQGLVRGQRVEQDVELDAYVTFSLNGRTKPVRITTEKYVDGYALVLNKNDLKGLIKGDESLYTDAEIELVAEYPYRALELIRIKELAAHTAQEAKKRDSTVPEDAYRHILWSYLLSRKYKPTFAKLITDAHEATDDPERYIDNEMDLINNRIGRELAGENYSPSEILELIRKDNRVIIRPGQS